MKTKQQNTNEIKSQPQTKILMREISFLKPPKNIHVFNSSTVCMAFSPHIKSLSKKGRSRMTTNIKQCPFIEREQRCKKS